MRGLFHSAKRCRRLEPGLVAIVLAVPVILSPVPSASSLPPDDELVKFIGFAMAGSGEWCAPSCASTAGGAEGSALCSGTSCTILEGYIATAGGTVACVGASIFTDLPLGGPGTGPACTLEVLSPGAVCALAVAAHGTLFGSGNSVSVYLVGNGACPSYEDF